MASNALENILHIERLAAAGDWQTWLLHFETIPVPLEERTLARDLMHAFVIALEQSARLTPEYFLQFNQLSNENGSRRLSDKGKEWMPRLGLGVWPDREPPSLWTEEEFRNVAPGEMVRPLMHQVFRVTKAARVRHEAMDVMFGIGAGLLILVREGDSEFLLRTTRLLLPRIEEPSLRAYEYYIPLMEVKSISTVPESVIDEWMCGAKVYIRESPEDLGVLILSSLSVAETWHTLGLKSITDGNWTLRK